MHPVPPIFIRLHYSGVETMVNIRNINRIVPDTNGKTRIYVDNRENPLLVEESYEEIDKKLGCVIWTV